MHKHIFTCPYPHIHKYMVILSILIFIVSKLLRETKLWQKTTDEQTLKKFLFKHHFSSNVSIYPCLMAVVFLSQSQCCESGESSTNTVQMYYKMKMHWFHKVSENDIEKVRKGIYEDSITRNISTKGIIGFWEILGKRMLVQPAICQLFGKSVPKKHELAHLFREELQSFLSH